MFKNNPMPPFHHRLATRLTAGLLVFFLLLVVTLVLLLTTGFTRAQTRAVHRSMQGLETQGRDALLQQAVDEATLIDERLMTEAHLAEIGRDILVTAHQTDIKPPQDGRTLYTLDQLSFIDAGAYAFVAEERRTDIFVPAFAQPDESLQRNIEDTAVLDLILPQLYEQSEDAVAIYFESNLHGVPFVRYYPVIDIAEKVMATGLITEETIDDIVIIADPVHNPERQTVWSPTYMDGAGNGLMITVFTPVYLDDTYRGQIGVDITLDRLSQRLENLRPTPNGFAFLVNGEGHLIAAPDRAVPQLFDADVTSLDELLEQPQPVRYADELLNSEAGIIDLEQNGETLLLAHADLPDIGWRLGIVVPLAEVTAQAETVEAGIAQDARQTLESTLAVLGVFLVLNLIGLTVIMRREILTPLSTLARGTQAITEGDLDVRLQTTHKSELGLLAESFNQMAAELADSRHNLEQRVAERTVQITTLNTITTVASASLELETVLRESLRASCEALPCTGGAITLTDASQPAVMHGEHDNDSSSITVPLVAKGEPQGTIILTPERAFSTEEMTLLASIGEQIGVAVENARLYQEAERLAVVEERQRLARELHDAVTQSLYSVTLLAEACRRAAANGNIAQVEQLVERVGTIGGQALKEMRLLVYELRPLALTQEGLVGALQHRLDAVEKRAGIDTRLHVAGVLQLSDEAETTLYRISQEALNNSLKHADANAVRVDLTQQNGSFRMRISDDGIGFDLSEAEKAGGMGLTSIRERTAQLGGTLLIDTTEGTTIDITLGDTHP